MICRPFSLRRLLREATSLQERGLGCVWQSQKTLGSSCCERTSSNPRCAGWRRRGACHRRHGMAVKQLALSFGDYPFRHLDCSCNRTARRAPGATACVGRGPCPVNAHRAYGGQHRRSAALGGGRRCGTGSVCHGLDRHDAPTCGHRSSARGYGWAALVVPDCPGIDGSAPAPGLRLYLASNRTPASLARALDLVLRRGPKHPCDPAARSAVHCEP